MEKIRKEIKEFFSVGPKSTFLLILSIIICFTVIYNMKKTLTIVIDGKETEIVTYTSDIRSSLERNNIVVGPKDKIQPSLDSKVKDGEKVTIKKAVNIKLTLDGKTLDIATAESSISDMLDAEGITVSESDKVVPLKTQPISENLDIKITRISTQLIKNVEDIDYATEIKKDNNLASNVTKVVQEGQTGEREITTRVVYEDGKETVKQVISNFITRDPVKKIMLQGTLGVLKVSRGGEQVLYKKSLRVKATAYCPDFQCTGKYASSSGYGKTSLGTIAKRNVNGNSTIAVDPNVIPLGTRVYVEGYGFAVAEDTGGAIKGKKIDVFFNKHNQADSWGVKYVNVYIIK